MGSTGMCAAADIHLTSHMPCHPGIIAFTRTIFAKHDLHIIVSDPPNSAIKVISTHKCYHERQYKKIPRPTLLIHFAYHMTEIITSPVLTYGYLKDFVITIHRDHIAKCCGMQEEH